MSIIQGWFLMNTCSEQPLPRPGAGPAPPEQEGGEYSQPYSLV